VPPACRLVRLVNRMPLSAHRRLDSVLTEQPTATVTATGKLLATRLARLN
jgi:hypothetical protein